jgi:hypothetical protein
MKKLRLMYRDGDNHKCHWVVNIPNNTFNELELKEEDIDNKQNSKPLVEIEDLGLTVEDIPLIQEYGFREDQDHNYVSITKIIED